LLATAVGINLVIPMKTAISVPDDVFERATRVAKRLGLSRSELFTRAVRQFLGAERDASITASYDEAFATDDVAAEDDVTRDLREAIARRSLLSVEWEDG
jgi:metal-responsive CopG/Arc/MetJ family transcriptional regulator